MATKKRAPVKGAKRSQTSTTPHNQIKTLKAKLREARSQIERLDVKVMESWRDLDQVATALGLHVEKRTIADILGAIRAERSVKEQAQQRATDADADRCNLAEMCAGQELRLQNMLREIGTRLFEAVDEPFDNLEMYARILRALDTIRATPKGDFPKAPDVSPATHWLDEVAKDEAQMADAKFRADHENGLAHEADAPIGPPALGWG